MRATGATALLAITLSGVASCDAPKSEATKNGPRILGHGRSLPSATPEPAGDGIQTTNEVLPPAAHSAFETMAAGPVYYTRKVGLDAATKPVDPDLAVVEAGKSAAAACFTGITDSSVSRSAVIHLTVLPSGTVNRSEVSTSSPEPWITTCLEGVGNGLHFSDKPAADIRAYSIDVTVRRTH